MTTHGNIGAGQAVILLFVSRCFNILNYVPAFTDQLENSALLYGNILGFAIQLIFIIPPLLLIRRYEGQNVITVAYNRNPVLGKVYAFLYFYLLFTQMMGTLLGFEYFMTNAVYPNSSIYFIVITMAAACFFCARYGIESISRASVAVFIFLILSSLTIFILSLKMANPLNLKPILYNPASSIIQAALYNISRSTEIVFLILLYPKIKGNLKFCSFGLIISSFLILECTVYIIVAVLGDFANTQTYPYYTLASITDTDLFQRLDSLHMMVWVFSAFIRTTLLVYLSNYTIQMVLPRKWHKITLPILFAGGCGLAIWIGQHEDKIKSLSTDTGIVMFILLFLLPLILLLFSKRKGKSKHEEKDITLSAHAADAAAVKRVP